MKTGPSKLFRKLALNRRSNRINNTVYADDTQQRTKPIPNIWKARTIPKASS